MKLAYIINQYPKTSHSFIRREILALEKLGVDVFRFSIRKSIATDCVDQKDVEELQKTHSLLGNGLLILVRAAVRAFLSAPAGFLKTLLKATAMGWNGQRGVVRHWAYLAEASLLKRLTSGLGITHIHAHFGTNSTTVAMLCKMLGGPDYSFTVHGPEEFDDPVGLQLTEKIENSKFTVAISDFCKSQLMRQCHHRFWHKIKVVHCAMDEDFYNSGGISLPDGPRLVCVGRLCEQKGQLLLVEALHVLDEQGVDFQMVFAGDGEMRSVLEQRIRDFRLEKRIAITGWLNGDQIKAQILASRALVLPSFAEGLPVVIMEAFALERPVLTTYIAGIPELVEPGCNGWLIPAGSLEALVKALKEVLAAPPEKILAMGRAGVAPVAANYNDLTEGRRLVQLFVDTSMMKED